MNSPQYEVGSVRIYSSQLPIIGCNNFHFFLFLLSLLSTSRTNHKQMLEFKSNTRLWICYQNLIQQVFYFLTYFAFVLLANSKFFHVLTLKCVEALTLISASLNLTPRPLFLKKICINLANVQKILQLVTTPMIYRRLKMKG